MTPHAASVKSSCAVLFLRDPTSCIDNKRQLNSQPRNNHHHPSLFRSPIFITRTMSAITSLARQLPRIAESASIRSFSVAARRMAEGDTGATRPGGAAQSDAFSKREKANEDFYVREEEKKKLEALRKKIADQEAQLAKDRKEAEDIVGKKQ